MNNIIKFKQMKRFFCLLCLFFPLILKGQNLVKNPGFEEYHHLPDLIYEYGRYYPDSNLLIEPLYYFICKDWYRPMATSQDYFHINAKNIRYGIPYSDRFGYYPAMFDSAYIGFNPLTLHVGGTFEYFTGEFSEPLEKGKKYEVSFFYCFAHIASYFSLDKIEVFISIDYWNTRSSPTYAYIVNQDIVANVTFDNQPIVNDGQWHKLTGYYQANGGEKYITFGIFRQNRKFHKMIREYERYDFVWGKNQNKLHKFFKKYQKDLFIHRNPYYITKISGSTKHEGTDVYYYQQQLAYYFIDNVSVVEID